MPNSPLDNALRHIRRITGGPVDAGDGELLERFISRHDEAAFETLVQRHGRMVLGACRSLLHHSQDAEDAFQATFLVLIRCAASVRKRNSLSSWLYGVAHRAAKQVLTAAARRRAREKRVAAMSKSEYTDTVLDDQDLQPVMVEELNRLPEKYRSPLLLCYLQGKTTDETAEELGWPRGTVAVRLVRGRDLLGKRLERRGITLSAAGLTAMLAQQASAAVGPGLCRSTVETALWFAAGKTAATGAAPTSVLALVEGVHRAMWIKQVKLALVLLFGLVVGVGGSVLTYRSLAENPPVVAANEAARPPTGEELAEQTFAKWYPYILPRKFEMDWQEIPWRATLWEGVVEAQAKDRPILLWVMNGHPCGET